MRTFQRVFTAVGLAAIVVTGVVAGGSASAAPAPTPQPEAAQTLTVFNATQLYEHNKYFAPPFTSLQNWVAPVNYSAGRARLQLQILSKPSSRPMLAQVCFWQHADGVKFKYETCAKSVLITDETSMTVDLGVPTSWWKKNGVYPYTRPPSLVRILLKDPATSMMMNDDRCGRVCYRGNDLHQHVPVNIRATLTITR